MKNNLDDSYAVNLDDEIAKHKKWKLMYEMLTKLEQFEEFRVLFYEILMKDEVANAVMNRERESATDRLMERSEKKIIMVGQLAGWLNAIRTMGSQADENIEELENMKLEKD